MQSFGSWLISESFQSLLNYKPIQNIIEKNKIPEAVTANIFGFASVRDEKEQIPYAEYLLGFYTKKPHAFQEDYERAIDNYTFYRRNKQRLYPSLNGQPFELGQNNETIQEIKDNNISNTRAKKQGRVLDNVDMSRVTTEHFSPYTFYTIPKATNNVEKLNNKQLYCLLGKGTDWCTASPDGTYYEMYVDKLDITVIYKDNKPLYQFGLFNGELNGKCQFMDVKDDEVYLLPMDLYKLLLRSKYQNILKLKQFNFMDNNKSEEDIQMAVVKERPHQLTKIQNASERVKLAAVKSNGYVVKFINDPSDEIQIYAVLDTPDSIRYIKNPTLEVQKRIMALNPEKFKDINNPDYEIQKKAVERSAINIKYIENPSEELQKLAIEKYASAIQFIKNPSKEVQRIADQKLLDDLEK